MKPVKKALVEILWLILAAIPMILAGLGFVAAAVYLSFVGLAVLFMGTQALGPLAYFFGVIGLALGAGAILLSVRMVNRRTDPRFVKTPVPTADGPREAD
jgi:uncharacterized membrane protein